MPKTFTLLILIISAYQTVNQTPLDYCSSIPLNHLSKCNVTCASCQADQTQCSTCQSYLEFTDDVCKTPQSERYLYKEYFTQTSLKYDQSLSHFSKSTGILSSDDVYRLCISNSYKFDIIGLFSSSDELMFQESYAFQSSDIALNFKLFYSSQTANIKINVNQKLFYNVTLNSGFTLNMTSTENLLDDEGIKWSIGVIETNPSSYIGSIFAPVRTDMLPLNNNLAKISITVSDGLGNNTSDKFWGIYDLAVVSKRCQTCISEYIKNMAKILGIIIAVSAGLVILLILGLYIDSLIKSSNYSKKLKKRFKQIQQKVAEQQRNLNTK